MAGNKIKFPLWLMPECKQVVEDNYREDQCQSRSEFIEKAIWFYAGFLHTLDKPQSGALSLPSYKPETSNQPNQQGSKFSLGV